MENQPVKLYKAVKISILMPVIILSTFILSGCKKADIQTNNAENQTNVEELSNKVDELQQYKDEQQQKEEEARQAEEAAKQAELLKQEQAEILAKEQAIKKDALIKCQDFQSTCKSKVNSIQMQIDEAERWIGQREDDIDSRNELIDECKDNGCKNGYEAAIAESKSLIKSKEKEIDEFKSKLNKLTSGECKGYKNPCE